MHILLHLNWWVDLSNGWLLYTCAQQYTVSTHQLFPSDYCCLCSPQYTASNIDKIQNQHHTVSHSTKVFYECGWVHVIWPSTPRSTLTPGYEEIHTKLEFYRYGLQMKVKQVWQLKLCQDNVSLNPKQPASRAEGCTNSLLIGKICGAKCSKKSSVADNHHHCKIDEDMGEAERELPDLRAKNPDTQWTEPRRMNSYSAPMTSQPLTVPWSSILSTVHVCLYGFCCCFCLCTYVGSL